MSETYDDLAEQLHAVKPELDVLAHPYRRAAEMTRRVEQAALIVADMSCQCAELNDTACARCLLDAALAGDS